MNGEEVRVKTEQVKVRVTGDAEVLAVLREVFAEAMEEFGLEVIEKGLPRAYGGHWAVFLTALRVEVDDAQSPRPSATPLLQGGQEK